MKIPPKKAHFFKPILQGFKDGLTIPIGFLKYLKGHVNAYAMLRRASKKWAVKVNGRRLEEGWEEFVKDHDLQLGDILIFRHEGDMEFEVAVFDSSYCEREYEQGVHEREEEKACIVEESSKKLEFKEKPKPNIKTSDEAFPNVEAAYKDSHSHFICTIKPYCLSKYCLCIPKQFAQENRLNDRKCMIIMRDEQRSWTLSVYTSGKKTYIGSGWREFCTTNCLKEGDRLMFEIVSNVETPIFRFHDLRGSSSLQAEVKKKNFDVERMSDKAITDVRLKTSDMTTPKSQVAASTSADANPHFISTIKPYTIRFPILYLPMAFAKLNGLLNRHELILVDEKRRSWSVWLGRIDNYHFGIKRGWRKFIKANSVQVGDTYKFELTNNGTIPVVHFHCKYTGKDAKYNRSH